MNAGEQLVLLVEEAERSEPRTRARGPRGLLLAWVRRGIDPGALRVAAALVLELDAMAAEGA